MGSQKMGIQKLLGCLALVVCIFSGLIANLGDEAKYEVGSRMFYPVFRFLFASGIFARLMLRRVDETSNFTLPAEMACPEWLANVSAWQPDERDVIVATFPKSGTHFMMQMSLQTVTNASDEVKEFESIHSYVTAMEALRPDVVPDAIKDEKNVLFLNNYREKSPLKTFIHTTHLDYPHTPRSSTAKYMVMIRDPLDALRSLHSMISKVLGRLAPTPDEMLPIFMGMVGGWAEWHRTWWMHRDDPNVLFLFYGDAVKNPAATVTQMAQFLGWQPDVDVVDRVVERISIGWMKNRSSSFEPPFMPRLLPFQKPQGTSMGMINTGKTGGGKSFFSEETRAAVRDACRTSLANMDFPFDLLPGCK